MILSARGLSKSYYRGKIEIPALKDINFDMQEGEFISILGKSGSGKSTLLNLLGGLDTPTSGELLFSGRNLGNMSRNELALHRRHSVGMVFQSFNLINSRSAAENIMLALGFGGTPRRKRKARALELLDMVGLTERAEHKPTELSGGESQRVAIARAIANEPGMILADEPTGNLDSTTSEEIMELLVSLNRDRGIPVIMVSHDREMATRLSNRIIELKDGSILKIREGAE